MPSSFVKYIITENVSFRVRQGSFVAILSLLSACSVLGGDEPTPVALAIAPDVTITSPSNGDTIVRGDSVLVQSDAVGAQAITRIELVVNSEVIRVDANADPQADIPFIVAQPWRPTETGTYTLQVWAYDESNTRGDSAMLTVTVVDALPTPTEEITPAPILTDTPSPTASATATFQPPQPPPTASPTSLPSPTPEPTPIPVPAATFAPTNFRPEGRFQTIWDSLGGENSSIGYPTGPQINNQDFAKQYFSGGVMYWWQNPAGDNLIWVIPVTGNSFQEGDQWYQFADTWDGNGDHSCDETRQNGTLGPIRGFGKIWCEKSIVSAQMGDPVEEERGSGGNPPFSVVQFYQGGVMLYNPLNSEVFVLFDSGKWQHFGY